jgi:O-acetyl-ADP-ribose deacetylase (regulator of RNase III)
MPSICDPQIRLFHGDITSLNCDAIVTAANTALCGGGGVDGAVHDAAGPELVRASMELAPCPVGEARITNGFGLAAKHVIHAVGPIFCDLETDSVTLATTYLSSLQLAAKNSVVSVAFPCISTGAFGFPADAASEIAIETVTLWLRSNNLPKLVTFCCFQSEDHARYEERLTEMGLLE